jgi:hypothetical protein
MMKTGTAAMGFRLVLVCLALSIVFGFAYPTAAGAQGRGEDDIPEQLWKTYPLDPTKMDADAPERVPAQPSRPESPNAQAQSSGESDSGLPRTLLLAGALLSLLVGLLIIAAARSGALGMGGGHPVRGGSALEAPLRAASNAPRYISRGGALVVYPLRMLPARRLLHRLLFFVLVVLLSAGVGLLVTVLLQP